MSQVITPGMLTYDEKRYKQKQRYLKAVERASFLEDDEKRQWKILGHLMDIEKLKAAEQLIINEDLKRLHARHQLEELKPHKH